MRREIFLVSGAKGPTSGRKRMNFQSSIQPSIYLSISPSIHPSIHLSVRLSVHLSIHLSVHLFVCPFLVCPFVHLSIFLSVHLSVCPNVSPKLVFLIWHLMCCVSAQICRVKPKIWRLTPHFGLQIALSGPKSALVPDLIPALIWALKLAPRSLIFALKQSNQSSKLWFSPHGPQTSPFGTSGTSSLHPRRHRLLGHCSVLSPFLLLITSSRAFGTADHVRSLDDW